ncbi:MAG TPA: hypothetical protein VLC48_08025 [Gemmatimonadota bacterium]|nr:hypothetical protein [Gemmatimonadota bacterium]
MSTTEALAPSQASLHPVFRAVATTVVPESAALDEAGWTELEALVVDSLDRRPRHLQRKLRLFLRLVQWLPLLRYGRPFTFLDADRRTHFLTRLQEHRLDALRVGFWGLRTLVFLGYYGRAAGSREIGYRPSPLGWSAYRR